MNNAFFGKTIENVRDKVYLEFTDHSQRYQLMKGKISVEFKGIVDNDLRLVFTNLMKKKQPSTSQFF